MATTTLGGVSILDDNDSRHGTGYAYRTLGCRCDVCRLAWNKQVRESAKRRRASYVFNPEDDHGTTRTYQRGCKCRPCLDAQSQYGRDFRRSKPARDGVCESCGSSSTVVWDHDHASGDFRGWLCRSCNLGLGHFGDNPEALLRAAKYLEER